MARIVNIKEDMPPKDYAVFLLEQAIDDCLKMGERTLVVIHGYGSHGQGGEIKKSVERFLTDLKRKKKIKAFVTGDKWGDTNPDKQLICKVSPELIINSQVNPTNHGVTIILIN